MRARLPVVTVVALALITPAVPAVAGPPPPSPLVFGACPDDVAQNYPTLTCATLQVPVDYQQPSGATIPLLVTKHAANNPSKRLGSLVVNPGGPGGSGVIMAGYVATPDETGFTPLEPAVLDAYDVIGFDPRGVRHSGAISCAAPDYFPVPQPDPDAPASRDALWKLWDGYADGCGAKAGALLPYLGTDSVARDMDRVRASLGEQKLNYLGFSYGTYLGAVYTELFPQRVGRMILDGNVDPTPPDLFYKMALSQDLAFPKRLNSYLGWVAKYDAVFHLGTTVRAVRANWNKTLADFRAKPHGAVGAHEFLGATFGVMTADELWIPFTQVLSAYVVGGDDSGLVDFATPSTSAQAERFTASFSAVICGDSKWSHSKATYERDAARIAKVSPVAWDNMWITGSVCRNWPVPDHAPIKITGRGLPGILMFNTVGDPATPYSGALKLHKVLRSSVLVTERDSGAHCVFANPQSMVNTAVNAIGTKYLLTGELPPGDLSVPGHALPVPTPAALKAPIAKSRAALVR
ncbi:alpha/beta hydrolase [Kribbella sp. NPDC058245]|uniref:alpha/beta hydrolase n=1 Tax=Kribbella sp. NPDC058245 TaxID=3346399 RepID=UPI0036E77475